MKFYRVHNNDDPAQSDALFATKKEREQYIKATYDADDDGVIRDELTLEGPLTKETVCRIYNRAIR